MLRECLRALMLQTVDCEVVVVDNGSVDGTVQAVAEEFPDVLLVRLEENVGFGRAVNLGAERATGEVLLVVNNDAVPAPDFAERMVAPFADPAVGMAAGVLTQRPHPDRVDSAGVELDVTVGSWDLGWNAPVASLGTRTPAGTCGGAAAYRASAWRDAGGFDPALFAYWEDVDLALRLRRAGWASRSCRAPSRCTATARRSAPPRRCSGASTRSAAGFVLGRHGRDGLAAALRVAGARLAGAGVRPARRPAAGRAPRATPGPCRGTRVAPGPARRVVADRELRRGAPAAVGVRRAPPAARTARAAARIDIP